MKMLRCIRGVCDAPMQRCKACTASTSTQNRKWKSLLLLLVTLSDGERPCGDAWPRRIDSRGPSGLERRASEAAGMARSRRAQTRGAGDNGSGFVVAAASLRRRSLIEPAQRSSTQRNAAGCCAGALHRRKGTASTACAPVCGSAAAHWSGLAERSSRVLRQG